LPPLGPLLAKPPHFSGLRNRFNMATSVIVDDTDPRITYTPVSGWYVGGVANELEGTAHGTDMAGATATFTFTGLEEPFGLSIYRLLI
jgi:hypothetical protein